MSTTGTLRDISREFAKKQPRQVDWLTEETPVLDVIPFEEASHTLWNVYDEVSDVSGGGFVDMDAPLDSIEVDTRLRKVDLSILGARMFCPEDKAKAFGGRDRYFGKKTPKALRKLGVDAEKAILYNNFRRYALDEGRLLDAGEEADACYTVLAMRFVPGETTGLYSTAGFRQGGLIDMKSINGGGLYENESGILGYGVRMKGYFGIQIANPETVAALVNVSMDSPPTAMQVDGLLDMVRAAGASYLFCHRKALSILADVGKGAAFQMTPADRKVDRRVAEWNGVPIVTSYNFQDGAEAHVDVE
ncbi:major capsid protein [Desulfocurvus sp. DL9XJH121]